MNLLSIPAGAAFLPELASVWRGMSGPGALHDGLILLPTRRAARELAAAFLRDAGGRAILLPRIVALGAIDEAPLALAGALTLPPEIPAIRRRAELARLILAKRDEAGVRLRADRAWMLAGELASLMDEAERAGIDLLEGLQRAADPVHALHWDRTLAFLTIVTEAWPAHLAEQGLANPAARQVALLEAQAEAWRAGPPPFPVLAVGNSGDIPAVGALLRVVAGLAGGAVVLPGLDFGLDEETWEALEPMHAQAGLRDLLRQMQARRGDVRAVGESAVAGRVALLHRALLPAAALDGWQTPFSPVLDGLARLSPADAQEEAVAIALILREALETPGATAAVVTPDRELAQRVGAELARWGVVADDSAGEPLGQTPAAVFLRLLAVAVVEQLAPVGLLALLKHPLAAGGLGVAAFRRLARLLERFCLRGPRPHPGTGGLRRAIDLAAERRRAGGQDVAPAHDQLTGLVDRLERCLEPLLRANSAVAIAPADLLAALVRSAEALAASDDTGGPARLWAQEDGEALATLLAEVQEALPVLPHESPGCLPDLLRAVLDGAVVRSRRATRGRGGVAHPRVSIWGLLEARLQSADVLVLGGLVEGVWPPASDPGPWMSRPMRASAGLPSAEARIGQAAQDFVQAVCAAPRVVLSVPRRRDGAPAVPARWVTRLEAMLRGGGQAGQAGLPAHPAVGWARALDLPAEGARPAEPPMPRPPVRLRPRRLPVTDVATLLRDPYEVYARRILGLRKLEPLEQSADFRDYGTVVHRGLDAYLREVGTRWPAGAAAVLAERLHGALREAGVREALIAWWSPRLHRIAEWVDSEERRRRAAGGPAAVLPEVTGSWTFERPGGPFTLTGRADRIERGADGCIAILDYKTGSLPKKTHAEDGREPQLLLEGAMVRNGAFGAAATGPVAELTYWRLSGSHEPGETLRLLADADPDAIGTQLADAADQLAVLIDRFDDPATAYPARPVPPKARIGDYAHLSRAAEWGAAQDEDGGARGEEE